MTKMVHKDTGEVFYVLGYYLNNKNNLVARCLGDARLHPYDKGALQSGSIVLTIPADILTPLDAIDWDAVKAESYPEGFFEEMKDKKVEERRRSLEQAATARYKQEYANCIKNGVPKEEAVRIAEETKAKYIEEKMEIPSRGDSKAMRMLKW